MTCGVARGVLVVEDDPGLRELYVHALGDDYDARGAATIADALDAADASVSVVVLDRRLPDGDGLDALPALEDATDGAFVVAVTAVDPGLGIVDAGIDDYLVKPVGPERVGDAVAALLERHSYEAAVARYYALASKRAALEAAHDAAALAEDERYQRLLADLEELRERVAPSPALVGEPRRARALYRDLGAEASD
ncbi:HalX domain-containing protein (plasmid) [Halarchaeum sp. CBA1220]|uniref:response regulator n=1 Tax=Halarchaeum sp. CBA1220 TaxID=1853682 RepID=UPI000F3AA007|nr:response regulator [Halarchaeum sp. CBA1220]QLC34921.1 HalX domain-containing protein [Halarchaeum sp. CBA1220]